MKLLNIGVVSITSENLEKFERYRNAAGDDTVDVVSQFVRGWLTRYRKYYDDLVRLDASLRGISYREYGELLFNDAELPNYLNGNGLTRDTDNPLFEIVLPQTSQTINVAKIPLNNHNNVLIRCACMYDGDSRRGWISRVVHSNLSRRWHERYKYQVEMEQFSNWI